MTYDFLYKIIVLGSQYNGKTSIIDRVVRDKFHTTYQNTIGIDFSSTTRDVSEIGKTIKFHLWDTAGGKEWAAVTNVYYKNVGVAIIVMDCTCENAFKDAEWLETQDEVAWVNYPGLKSSKYYDLSKKYLKGGQSGIVTFGLKGGFESAKKLTDSTKIFSLLANFGDSKSLIIHPSSTTHQQLNEDQQKSTGVTSDLVRLSVGLEDPNDLINDLKEAIKSI